MKLPLFLITLLLAQSLAAAAPPADPLRVTGIITIGDRHEALIELADGSQQQVRPGDAFAGGVVLDITRNAVHIGFEDDEQILPLAGDPNRPAFAMPDTPVYVRSPEPVQVGTGKQILKREVVGTGLEQELTRIAEDMDRTTAVPADPAEVPGEEGKEKTIMELTRLIGPLVDLPPEDRVVGINHQPLTTAREGIGKVQQELATGNVVQLNIESRDTSRKLVYLMPDGNTRVYLRPDYGQ